MTGDIRAIGAFLVIGLAAVLSYFAWAISTERQVYGGMGRPPVPVMIYMAANAIAAVIGTVILFKM